MLIDNFAPKEMENHTVIVNWSNIRVFQNNDNQDEGTVYHCADNNRFYYKAPYKVINCKATVDNNNNQFLRAFIPEAAIEGYHRDNA
jgi:hypothetical protein